MSFCISKNISPLPLNESHLCRYMASLAEEGLTHQTLKCYLSAARHLQIMAGHGDPFVHQMPVLEYVLRGIKSDQAKKQPQPKRSRLPITPPILRRLRRVWDSDSQNWDNVMIWAACCTCFFGFLRSGEITVASSDSYDPGAHLSVGDVTLDDRSNPTFAQVNIKASKTDPFRKGVSIYLGRTGSDLCPVAALAAYLALRGGNSGAFLPVPEWSASVSGLPRAKDQGGSPVCRT